MALVDALGSVASFMLLPGQRHDNAGKAPLIDEIEIDALLGPEADRGAWFTLDEAGSKSFLARLEQILRTGVLYVEEEL